MNMRNQKTVLQQLCIAAGLPEDQHQFSLSEVAAMMRCKPEAIMGCAAAGELPVYGVKRCRWVLADDLERFVQSTAVNGTEQAGTIE